MGGSIKRVSKGCPKGSQKRVPKGVQKGVRRVSEGSLMTPFWPQSLPAFRPKEAYSPKVGAKRTSELVNNDDVGVIIDVGP